MYTINVSAGPCSCTVFWRCFKSLAGCLAWLFLSSNKRNANLLAPIRIKLVLTVCLQDDGCHLQESGHCQCCWPHDDACHPAGESLHICGSIPRFKKVSLYVVTAYTLRCLDFAFCGQPGPFCLVCKTPSGHQPISRLRARATRKIEKSALLCIPVCCQ